MDKSIMELVNEYHRLKNENENLLQKNFELALEVERLEQGILETKDNCFVYASHFGMNNSHFTYQLFNPTDDVNASIISLLKDKGITIDKGICSNEVAVNGKIYYENPYCEEARLTLDRIEQEIKRRREELEILKKEVEWLSSEKKCNSKSFKFF